MIRREILPGGAGRGKPRGPGPAAQSGIHSVTTGGLEGASPRWHRRLTGPALIASAPKRPSWSARTVVTPPAWRTSIRAACAGTSWRRGPIGETSTSMLRPGAANVSSRGPSLLRTAVAARSTAESNSSAASSASMVRHVRLARAASMTESGGGSKWRAAARSSWSRPSSSGPRRSGVLLVSGLMWVSSPVKRFFSRVLWFGPDTEIGHSVTKILEAGGPCGGDAGDGQVERGGDLLGAGRRRGEQDTQQPAAVLGELADDPPQQGLPSPRARRAGHGLRRRRAVRRGRGDARRTQQAQALAPGGRRQPHPEPLVLVLEVPELLGQQRPGRLRGVGALTRVQPVRPGGGPHQLAEALDQPVPTMLIPGGSRPGEVAHVDAGTHGCLPRQWGRGRKRTTADGPGPEGDGAGHAVTPAAGAGRGGRATGAGRGSSPASWAR